ncbi:hypothetical protein LMG31506_06347 [Cupriavidus yeoncheonensis]|uniref:EthD domain-containing protein n=1 Tax=Cupriavidus yeoncheonensis TaxID=1462994 RepID=A0A916N807_9BURK|nr:EthD family reductase [Cupriavidus yeoncheonensis]CAG2158390.1 hypothetical protein LMG31506_06347 [Cupriavidus yeoncheonensis]
MIHFLFLFKRRDDVDRQDLLRYWREVHAPVVAGMAGVRRYIQNSVMAVPGSALSYDGVEDIWVDDEAVLHGLPHCAADCKAAPVGMGGLIDLKHSVSLRTTDHIVHAGLQIGREEALPKRMTFFKRKPGLGREDMLQYWRGTHGPLAASVPGLRRYVQSAMLPAAYESGEPRFDGAAQIWIEDDTALRALVSSKRFRESVKPDEANFVATDTVLTLPIEEERRIVWLPEP